PVAFAADPVGRGVHEVRTVQAGGVRRAQDRVPVNLVAQVHARQEVAVAAAGILRDELVGVFIELDGAAFQLGALVAGAGEQGQLVPGSVHAHVGGVDVFGGAVVGGDRILDQAAVVVAAHQRAGMVVEDVAAEA